MSLAAEQFRAEPFFPKLDFFYVHATKLPSKVFSCKACGVRVGRGQTFCGHCWKDLRFSGILISVRLQCSRCGRFVGPEDVACHEGCGADLRGYA